MADRELWYASGGPLLYDDTEIATNWYPAPYDILPLRAALLSQAYLTDAPVNDIEVARRMDVDGTPGTILKAGASGLPADSVITEDGTNITITGRNLLLSLTGAWSLGSATVLLAGVFSNAFRMPTGAGAGKIIESDADGDFSWVTHIVPTHNILSASHADSLIASVILGDILHGNVTPVWARLAGNITTTKKFLTQIGTGAISAIPIWDTIVDGDVPATHSGSAHHVAVTVSAPISLSGQALSLVNNAIAPDTITAIDVGVLANSDTVIPTSKAVTTAIGATGHAAVTLSVAAEVLLGLSTQELSLDTQTANLLFAGPVSGAVAAPTFRALVNADFPATLNPTFAGLGATPIITSYAGSQVIGGAVSGNVGLSVFVSPSTPTGNVWGTQYLQVLTPGGTNKAAAGVYFGTYCFMVAGQVHTSFVSLDVTAPYIIPASGASVTESTTFRVVGASTAGVKNYAVNILAGASRFGALTASLPIVTDSDKVLVSLAYTGATSFRKNLGLETDDSPTFAGIVIADAGTIGLGSGKGLIQFDDEVIDTITFLNCNVGIGEASSTVILNIKKNQDTGTYATISNLNVSTGAYCGISFIADAGGMVFSATGSIYTGFGLISASKSILYSTSPAGILFLSTGVSAPIVFATGGISAASERMRIAADGKIGFGTTLPQSLLDAQGPVGTGAACAGILTLATKELTIVATDQLGRINFNAPLTTAGGDAILVGAAIWAEAENTFSATVNETALIFATGASEAATEKVRIDHHGNVGIGDTAPGELLDVAGNINLTGVLKIDDVQVVSNRVVDATIDNGIEAAFTALYPLASALLAGIQTAIKTHGLMAAA